MGGAAFKHSAAINPVDYALRLCRDRFPRFARLSRSLASWDAGGPVSVCASDRAWGWPHLKIATYNVFQLGSVLSRAMEPSAACGVATALRGGSAEPTA
jgi:hypothetical protein